MKRIILCADGTWNETERKDKVTGRPQPTNVLKITRAVLPQSADGITQVMYYHEGVGTDAGLDKFTGGAFGRGMEKNVRALYRFLVYNYEPGDEIYLFGFSRGAFTVRTLVGFMQKVGLLQKRDEYYTPEIYKLYERRTTVDSAAWQDAFRNIGERRPSPPILFIGVWDTVGALGAPGLLGRICNRNKYKYHDIELNPMVRYAYHALAIDERRKSFTPNLWVKPPEWKGTLEQVWFAGVHSNIGGSYSPDGLANEALHWIIEKAEEVGLEFDKRFLSHYLPCFNSVLNNSMTIIYRVMGSFVRPIDDQLADEQAIHQSVLDRMNLSECRYHPKNVREYLETGRLRISNTQRIARGTPCPSMD